MALKAWYRPATMLQLISSLLDRCRFRFGLRLIFLATALSAAGLAYRMHQVRSEAEAVEHIAQLGGSIVYGSQAYAGAWLPDSFEPLAKPAVVAVDLSGTHLRAKDLKQIGVLSGLTRLNLQNSQIETGVLGPLTKLGKLESLLLANARITDSDLTCLAKLENLRTLSLTDTPIGDEGLLHAAELTRIENLNLCGTEVTAAGLGRLKSLPNLITLAIEDTCVTRSTVRSLRTSARLQSVNVNVRAGLGRKAYELLGGFQRTSIRAVRHPNGTVLWDPSRPWQQTTGGVLMQVESKLNLDEAEIAALRDVLTRGRPNGHWMPQTTPRAFLPGLPADATRSGDPAGRLAILLRDGATKHDLSKTIEILRAADPKADHRLWFYGTRVLVEYGLADQQSLDQLRQMLAHADPRVRIITVDALVNKPYDGSQGRRLTLDEAQVILSLLKLVEADETHAVMDNFAAGLAWLAQQNAEIAPVCHRELRQWLASDAAHTRASTGSLVYVARAELDQNEDTTIASIVVRSLLQLSRDPDARMQLRATSALARIATPRGDGGG